MGKRKDLTYWNIPAPKSLDEAVERAVKAGTHASKSDFVRDAVRRLLRELGSERNPTQEKETESGR
jgi:Arc/MetJ-type ribon-helix-helix transcriptional regulator